MVKRLGRRVLSLVVMGGAASVVGMVGVAIDSWRLASTGVIGLLVSVGLLLLQTHLQKAEQLRRMELRVSRDVANVSARVVTESEALQRILRASGDD
ncbi:hypothetical protein [Aeromicrobium terrae]|uniref:Uncharacterized protein n=1 Tax=Aeromicrobium terrae TaxID=2498846 RepID=A0A5C8NMZ7_9ACTN|nr:hypothetical protein [Aeromicrobium terrae]TXL62325.1 hypothetical protein FHP06_06430 [Aeromicrobium terrae]